MPNYEELKSEVKSILEIVKQYPEGLQPAVFNLLLNKYLGIEAPVKPLVTTSTSLAHDAADQQAVGRKKQPRKETYQIVKDLNLASHDELQSFNEFVAAKQPASNIEFNAVAVYYLTKILALANVGTDHVYTCYKEVSRGVPERLLQSIYDTSGSRYGYIDATDVNNIRMSTRGENLVELQLPKGSAKQRSPNQETVA